MKQFLKKTAEIYMQLQVKKRSDGYIPNLVVEQI
jgi:hypothetical protein